MLFTSYAKKLGMASYYNDDGVLVPITLLQLHKVTVADKVKENTYTAVFYDTAERKLSKPHLGFLKKHDLPHCKFVKTMKQSDEIIQDRVVNYSFLKSVKKVSVRSRTAGKGFQGAMKRHNFRGLRASHGVSISHRSHGSTGACQDPGKVFKGKKMAGQMGNRYVTTKNLLVVFYDHNRSLLAVKGCVPGKKDTLVEIFNA